MSSSAQVRSLRCVVLLAIMLVPGSAPAGLFGRIRDRLRQRVDQRVDKLKKRIEGTLDRPCGPEFSAALKAATDAQKRCLEDPPPGSPVDKFEKLSEKDAKDFCGRRSDEECLDHVLDQQEKFCDVKIASLVAQAAGKRAVCLAEDKNCIGLNVRLAANLEQIGVLQGSIFAAETALKGLKDRLKKQLDDDAKLRAQCRP